MVKKYNQSLDKWICAQYIADLRSELTMSRVVKVCFTPSAH